MSLSSQSPMSSITEKSVELPLNPTMAQLEAEKALNLELLRRQLFDVNVKDLVPMLVARHVLRTYEMGAVYSKTHPDDQLDKLIDILKTKNHWVGPMVDALIRSGQTAIAESILKQHTTST